MSDKQTILIVEDDQNLAEMLHEFFGVQGYNVITSEWGEDAVKTCQEQPPNLALLDIRLPDIDGYEVARRLQAHRRTRNIPVIFLTEKRDRTDRLRGLELGVVDYITKPFDLQELQLRVRNALRRASLTTLFNPVTGLPEGELVDECLQELLTDTDWAILVINLRRMNRFREAYGFVAADDVLRAVAMMLSETVRQAGTEDDVACHLTAENFIVITSAARANDLQERIRARLSQSIDYFYPIKDRSAAGLSGDRLMFVMGMFTAPETPLRDLDALKMGLMRSLPN